MARSMHTKLEEPCFLLSCLEGSFDGRLSASQEMPTSLWSKLPLELLQRIVDMLPLLPLVRFRAVARRWRSHLSEANCKKNGIALPVCTLLHKPASGGSALSTVGNTVIELGLSFLPGTWYDYACLQLSGKHYYAEDGLVCFKAYQGGHWRFCVFNPISGQYQQLPQRSSRQEIKDPMEKLEIRLCRDRTSAPQDLSFRVLVVSRFGIYRGTDAASLFSSATGTWKRVWRREVLHNGPLFAPWPGHTAPFFTPWPQFIVSQNMVVAGYGPLLDSYYVYQDGLRGVQEFTPSFPDDRPAGHIWGSLQLLEVLGQLYWVEDHCAQVTGHRGRSCLRGAQQDDEDEEPEDEDFQERVKDLDVRIIKVDGEVWNVQSVMPLTLGGISLLVEEDLEEGFEYAVAEVAVVKDAMCLIIGVRKRGQFPNQRSPWPSDYFYCNMVLYHPETQTWELVDYNMLPERYSDHHKLFEPRFY